MADSILEREFLPLRARLLDVAATLDRLDRSEDGQATKQVRQAYQEQMQSIEAALRLLLEGGSRAERMQLLFSLPYNESWQAEFKVPPPKNVRDGQPSSESLAQDIAEDVGQ